ncbi:MAG: helix-turn-helix domain-containing protein, partial [Erysipelotrichaceae bacterium]|nr:helix-turn-helix domain-containing protein [Erysipelotrichaceae bacterium]
MNFAKNLRYLRHKSGHSQEKLAEELHYKSFTTIQKWEDGTSTPPYKVIEKIAEMYHVTVDAIMHGNMEENQSVNVPILGIVRGGEPIYAEQNTLGYEPVSPQETAGGEYFYLEVVGDSMMNDRILPGDILYVRKQNTL